MSHLCAICFRCRDEREPAFMRYQLGTLDGWLCDTCAKPIRNAVTRAMGERVQELRHAAAVRQRRKVAPKIHQSHRQVRRDWRMARAYRLAQRLVGEGAERPDAFQRASLMHGLKQSELERWSAEREARAA